MSTNSIHDPLIGVSFPVNDTAGQRVAIPTTGFDQQLRQSPQFCALITNVGPNPAFIREGDVSVQAAVPNGSGADVVIPNGQTVSVRVGQTITHISAICSGTQSAQLYISYGIGSE